MGSGGVGYEGGEEEDEEEEEEELREWGEEEEEEELREWGEEEDRRGRGEEERTSEEFPGSIQSSTKRIITNAGNCLSLSQKKSHKK